MVPLNLTYRHCLQHSFLNAYILEFVCPNARDDIIKVVSDDMR